MMVSRVSAIYRNIQKLLPTFEAAARHESFTLAGDEIGLTQSSVSKQIMELERRLGQPLFIRTHKKIAVTSAGHRLLKAYAQASAQVIDALEDLLQESSRQQICGKQKADIRRGSGIRPVHAQRE